MNIMAAIDPLTNRVRHLEFTAETFGHEKMLTLFANAILNGRNVEIVADGETIGGFQNGRRE